MRTSMQARAEVENLAEKAGALALGLALTTCKLDHFLTTSALPYMPQLTMS